MSDQQHRDPEKVLLIDKPYGWTSFGIVKKVRYQLKLKKVGHAGTLDPLATGLLILCTGKKTKEIESFMGMEKEYTGTFTLGLETESHDLERPVNSRNDIQHLTEEYITKCIANFTGEIKQTPPQHSAIKVNGKRAYQSARKGQEVTLKERLVVIHDFDFTYRYPNISFRIRCSKGTYIRSLARDIGLHLGVGACLTSLRRTKIGDFKVENALKINELPTKEEFAK